MCLFEYVYLFTHILIGIRIDVYRREAPASIAGLQAEASRSRLKKILFLCPPFFQYNRRLLRQNAVGRWGILVYALGWTLASQF